MQEFTTDIATLTPEQAREQLVLLEQTLSHLNGVRVGLMVRAFGQAAPPPSDELISLDDAAKQIGVSRVWFYRKGKKLPFLRKINGKRTMVSKQALDRWCETRKPR